MVKFIQVPAMREVLVEGLGVPLAVGVLLEAQDPGVYPDLDHVPDHHPGESKFCVSNCVYVTCNM